MKIRLARNTPNQTAPPGDITTTIAGEGGSAPRLAVPEFIALTRDAETQVAAVRDTGVAFLCLAQLNRESEKDKGRTPRISDLADSGQIERDADTVLLLHRERKASTEAKLIIGKQRDGETGICNLVFDGRFCRFVTGTNQPEPDTDNDSQPRYPHD